MLQMGRTEYPPEVSGLLEKLDRDEDILRAELCLIEGQLNSITALRERIIADYGAPPPPTLKKDSVETPGTRGGSECPLSVDEIKRLADPAAILAAFAQSLPEARIYPTASARWITNVGIVERDFRSYRVTLRRLMENDPETWRKESDGGFTHIPTEERHRFERENRLDLENCGTTVTHDGNPPSPDAEHGQDFTDI